MENSGKFSNIKNFFYDRYFNQWINIKHTYSDAYNKRARGMTEMLNFLGIKLVGRHHSGIDGKKNFFLNFIFFADSRNIARIAIAMLKEKIKFEVNGWGK
jgi:inhibitor of KinA sporulation pathway (predicted exonuclease)